MQSNCLEHHGVMGMHWGIRRYQPYGEGGYIPKDSTKSRNTNKSVVKERKRKRRNRRVMSDEEIRDEISRIKQENELKRLIDEDINPGRTETKRILKQAGSKAATMAATGALLYAGKAFLEKKFDMGKAAEWIFQKPKFK